MIGISKDLLDWSSVEEATQYFADREDYEANFVNRIELNSLQTLRNTLGFRIERRIS